MVIADTLRRALEQTGLDVDTYADLAGVDSHRLDGARQGQRRLEPWELDRCARVVGVRFEDFLAGEVDRSALPLLLRNIRSFVLERDDLAACGALPVLGEFHRCVRDIDELERVVGIDGSSLVPSSWPASETQHPAEVAARRMRGQLDLEPHEPIDSVRQLLAGRLGVRTLFVRADPDSLDGLPPEIEGACTLAPRPAVLVNLIDRQHAWWRTRMILAHELGHLVFHATAMKTLFSPYRPYRGASSRQREWRWGTLLKGFRDIEVQADAFAACLLAPASAIRQLVGDLEPTSREAVVSVARRFGVGRTVSINRLQHVFLFDDLARDRMVERADRFDSEPRDVVSPADVGLRAGSLRELVARALADGAIDGARARRYLAVPATEELKLPGLDLGPELAAPLVSAEDVQRRRALRFLSESHGGNLHPGHVERRGDVWWVEVVAGGVGDPSPSDAGFLELDEAGVIVNDHVDPPA